MLSLLTFYLIQVSAFYHFTFKSSFMMRKLSLRRLSTNPTISSTASGDAWHHDIMAYLGGINVGYAVLAALRLYSLSRGPSAEDGDSDVLALTVLSLANASQAVLNFGLSSKDRWIMGKGLDRITVLDAVFAVLDAAVVVARMY